MHTAVKIAPGISLRSALIAFQVQASDLSFVHKDIEPGAGYFYELTNGPISHRRVQVYIGLLGNGLHQWDEFAILPSGEVAALPFRRRYRDSKFKLLRLEHLGGENNAVSHTQEFEPHSCLRSVGSCSFTMTTADTVEEDAYYSSWDGKILSGQMEDGTFKLKFHESGMISEQIIQYDNVSNISLERLYKVENVLDD